MMKDDNVNHERATTKSWKFETMASGCGTESLSSSTQSTTKRRSSANVIVMDDYSEGCDVGSRGENEGKQSLERNSYSETRWRSTVVLMLIVNAALVLVSTYVFLSRQETAEFEASFRQSAKTLTDSSRFVSSNIVDSFQGTADYISSYAEASKSKFPCVKLPHFELTGYHLRNASFTEIVGFAPIVEADKRLEWEKWSVENQDWICESRGIHENITEQRKEHHSRSLGTKIVDPEAEEVLSHLMFSGDNNAAVSTPNVKGYNDVNHGYNGTGFYTTDTNDTIPTQIHGKNKKFKGEWVTVNYTDPGPFMPIWQISPPPRHPRIINFDMNTCPIFSKTVANFVKCPNHPMITKILNLRLYFDSVFTLEDHMKLHGMDPTKNEESDFSLRPHSVLYQPVFDLFGADPTKLVGTVFGFVSWDKYFSNLLPDGEDGIYCVVENTCGQSVTYLVNGKTVDYLGNGDSHDPKYNYLGMKTTFVPFLHPEAPEGECEYSFSTYPSEMYRKAHKSCNPELFTGLLGLLFVATAIVFCGYVRIINNRQNMVMELAEQASNIVASLFPSSVRDRLMEEAKGKAPTSYEAPKTKLKRYLSVSGRRRSNEEHPVHRNSCNQRTKPIADLFPEATVMFADIVGFTAWSSVREPAAVFELLETLYAAFDEIAHQRRVFKVETVGDCYVAVAGLPDPRTDHAVVMAKFARECMKAMTMLTKSLEVTLGPDTGDLSMRFGLHSGPITAGVLRGDRSRFQLFGDTVNTASRMESTCMVGRIQISQETADLLEAVDLKSWFSMRGEKVQAKGKGELQTYWLDESRVDAFEFTNDTNTWRDVYNSPGLGENNKRMQIDRTYKAINSVKSLKHATNKSSRLIDWNVDQLLRLLKQIVARRQQSLGRKQQQRCTTVGPVVITEAGNSSTVFDEVKEIITLPKFNAKAASKKYTDPESVQISVEVVEQLRDFVTKISGMYRNNAFHNFEHASHVTMSVIKLLSRIVAPGEFQIDENHEKRKSNVAKQLTVASHLHDFSYGITSDPLTQFAVVFSALIHDVDHVGVPNSQLVKERSPIAHKYKNQSVAEQNSVDLAWNLLMDPMYEQLRNHIYCNFEEALRFRQLVVNSVMATDIIDKDLKELRNSRWDKVFSEGSELISDEDVNRKATIVIEHLIQASDVSHTMQHWHVYRRWNEHLFKEMYLAYKNGRAEKNPAEFWYKGEIGFFDFYIIPLAKKLKECGCFGVFSDEYLNYALENRSEWMKKGESILKEMVERVESVGADFSSLDASSQHSSVAISDEELDQMEISRRSSF